MGIGIGAFESYAGLDPRKARRQLDAARAVLELRPMRDEPSLGPAFNSQRMARAWIDPTGARGGAFA